MESGQATQSRAPSTCTDTREKDDETLSLANSSLFFQGNDEIKQDVHPRCEKEDDNHSSASVSTYWLHSTEEYNDTVEVRPEVSSSMALATKSFWEKPLSEDKTLK